MVEESLTSMFSKILIANRGEIACRVMRTARRLGVATVAVYSDADRDALHVAMADEAAHIGPPPAAQSYLDIERIVEAALATGAQAVHPGYGFLSENPDFVRAVEAAGLTFIGPSADAIAAMGLKDSAKALMEKAGVPVVPGYHGDDQDPGHLAAEADEIGYPVLIKARAGGGGKGMRRVDDPAEFGAALEGAQREGEASFGDARVLIEKYLTKPRHIEVQVFGDAHGNVVHLFERDCSAQRRHQKVIEEAPAPGMSEDMRAAMGGAAVNAAQAIGYAGAGTVEFIADVSAGLDADKFFFMEMNTRLQVEHPVTELITGHDLVEWQLRVAAGEPLPARQSELAIEGWAFEARIYAEDVPKGFLPATGRLDYLSLPEDGARVDSGVRQGDVITPHYDPMIAKVITHGRDRDEALARLAAALSETRVAGLVTNVEFLGALATHADFASGNVDTGLIDRELAALTKGSRSTALETAVAALVALGFAEPPAGDHDPWSGHRGWRHWSSGRAFTELHADGEEFAIAVQIAGPDLYEMAVDGETLTLTLVAAGCDELVIEQAAQKTRFGFHVTDRAITLFCAGRAVRFTRHDPLQAQGAKGAQHGDVTAPLPGLVKSLKAKAQTRIGAGEPVAIIEAMKMEHTLTAPVDGIVEAVHVAEGDQIDEGQPIVTISPASTDAPASAPHAQ